MPANTTPDDVRFAWQNFSAIMECGSSIRRPCHFINSFCFATLYPLDAETRTKALLGAEISNKFAPGSLELAALLRCQVLPVFPKARQLFMRRHRGMSRLALAL